MTDQKRNTWGARVRRTFTSILPIAENRTGKCTDCGECCKLPNVCPFLKSRPDGGSRCFIYPIRPLNCKKYPRTGSELITGDVCGFRFD